MTDNSVFAYLSIKVYQDLTNGQTFGDTGRFQVLRVKNELQSGYFGAVIKDTLTGEVILANRGTDTSHPEIYSDLGADSFIVRGDIPTLQFNAAKDLLEEYETQFGSTSNYVPVTTAIGHSLGGYSTLYP